MMVTLPGQHGVGRSSSKKPERESWKQVKSTQALVITVRLMNTRKKKDGKDRTLSFSDLLFLQGKM